MKAEGRLRDLLCAELKRQLGSNGGCATRLPAGGELVWRWFLDLNRSRTYHMSGPNPISYAEISAYARSMHWPMEPRHIAILRAMDGEWMEHARRQSARAPEGGKTPPTVSPTPVTAAVLDAMFG